MVVDDAADCEKTMSGGVIKILVDKSNEPVIRSLRLVLFKFINRLMGIFVI